MDDKHREILQSNHTFICRNVSVKDSGILDELKEALLISSDEADDILNPIRSCSQKTARLLYHLKRKDSSKKPFYLFVKALKSSHSFVSDKLLKDLENVNENDHACITQEIMCYNCFLLKNLNPDVISQKLYEDKAFSDDELEEINDPIKSRRCRVQTLLSSLAKYHNKKIIKTFKDYIRETFTCAFETSENATLDEFLVCKCEKNIATNKMTDRRNQLSTNREMALSRSVPKIDPNSSKVSGKLKNLWNDFWYLREQGKWLELRTYTDAAFEKYKQNPDIKFFLHRSEMCTSTFYLEDKEKAEKAYQKALDIFPKTSIPDWQLGRLIALRIYMCTQDGKLAEAQKLITEIEQTLSCLTPCLATGTIHFFKGIYYSEFLRRHCNGFKKQEVFEIAKRSFLLAIEHYAEEHLFEVETWRDEIYLFLPLLEMHVDFKKLNYIHFQRPSKTDFKLVRYYLDLFENECWGRATTWSKMMYNIARGKQHEFADNLARCVDYFRQAKYFADQGNFKGQGLTIGTLITQLSERLLQQEYQHHRRCSLSSGNSSSMVQDSSE